MPPFPVPRVELDSPERDDQRRRLQARLFGFQERYEVLGELGRGNMGVVYVAHDTKLERRVAIKQVLGGGAGHRSRLIREALSMARLSHPNVIPIYEIGELHDSTFIVMEFVDGITLTKWLAEAPRSQAEILSVFKAAARGLDAAHQKDLVHRDFKPDNVMVGQDGRVRVGDFGLARAAARPVDDAADTAVASAEKPNPGPFATLTQTGALLGTPAYMSPEQFRARRAGPASDQFSFCVALYEALHGQRPFGGASIDELRNAVIHGQVREPPRDSQASPWLSDLVMRGLSTEPEARFESMDALLASITEGELVEGGSDRPPPPYVFVAHDQSSLHHVVRMCEGLIDHGVRPWLDLWEHSASADLDAASRTLEAAPVVLVCGAPELDAVLEARIQRDPASVHLVRFAGEDAIDLGPGHASLTFDEPSWDDNLLVLARSIGVDRAREGWLEREAQASATAVEALAPYCGLKAFRERDARWMFGRNEEVEAILELIRSDQTRFLTLIGASGSGKSSLLMAGVCPMLRHGAALDGHQWDIAYLRPGPRPCEALAHAIVNLEHLESPLEHGLTVKRLRSEFLEDSATLRLVLGYRKQGRTLLVIDQLEELFTEARLGEVGAGEEAMAFVRNLLEATQELAGLDGKVWIAATLRADFVQRGLELPELARALQAGTYFALPPMREAQIRAAVERPAARVGYRVEAKLVDKLVAAAANQAGRLPLLQHVLRELWARRDRGRRTLNDAAYLETGGLEGAIAAAAERALESLRAHDPQAELVTRRLMTRLVHLGNQTSQDTRRRVPLAELGDGPSTPKVLEAFVRDARVLVAAEVDGIETVEIAHEALLREWTTLGEWLDADREALELRQELARDAEHWRSTKAKEYLWGRARTEEGRRVLEASVVELNDAEREFLEASERLNRRRRLSLQGGITALLTAATIVIVVISRTNTRLEWEKGVSEERRLEAEGERKKAQIAEGEALEEKARADELRTQAEHARTDAEKSQKENERSVRQMFEVSLRPLTESLVARGQAVGSVVVDERWTPLLNREAGVVVAASLGETFRVVVAGHESLLSEADADGHSLFLEITARWLLADQARRKIAIATQQPDSYARLRDLERNLLRLSHEVETHHRLDAEALEDAGMLILDNRWAPTFEPHELELIREFVENGGGVLAAGFGRSWLDEASPTTGTPTLSNYPMNQALVDFGVEWSGSLVSPKQLAEREVAAIVRFENSLAVEVDLFTQVSEREEYYTTLRPGEAIERSTIIGMHWVFRAKADGRELDRVEIEDQEQTFNIGKVVAKTRSKPRVPADEGAMAVVSTGGRLLESVPDELVHAAKERASVVAKECGKEFRTLMPRLTLTLAIDQAGAVAVTNVEPPARGSKEAGCVTESVSTMRFPKTRKGGEVTWTLRLY